MSCTSEASFGSNATRVERDRIMYIRSHSTSDADLLASAIEIQLGVSVCPFHWRDPDYIRDERGAVPCCILVSPPFGGTEYPSYLSPEGMWNLLHAVFPTVPVLWLNPDASGVPPFLQVQEGVVEVLNTGLEQECYDNFTTTLRRLSGLK